MLSSSCFSLSEMTLRVDVPSTVSSFVCLSGKCPCGICTWRERRLRRRLLCSLGRCLLLLLEDLQHCFQLVAPGFELTEGLLVLLECRLNQ